MLLLELVLERIWGLLQRGRKMNLLIFGRLPILLLGVLWVVVAPEPLNLLAVEVVLLALATLVRQRGVVIRYYHHIVVLAQKVLGFGLESVQINLFLKNLPRIEGNHRSCCLGDPHLNRSSDEATHGAIA